MPGGANYLTVPEVARLLEVHQATVRRWIRDGKLPAVRLPSGVRLVPRAAVEAVLAPLRETR